MKVIFNAIVAALKNNAQTFKNKGLEPVAHFDIYKGQYEDPEIHQPYNMPAVFYEWDADWENVTNLRQRGNMKIRLHIVLDNYGESFDGSADQEYALQIEDYHSLVFSIIQGLGGNEFTRLNRVRSEPARIIGYVYPYILTFTCQVEDNSADVLRNYESHVLDDLAAASDMKEGAQVSDGDSSAGFVI